MNLTLTDGSGYVEDGREVFDDDLDDQNVALAKGASKGRGKKDLSKGSVGKKSNIKNLITGMPTKNKEVSICSLQNQLLVMSI